MEKLPCRFVWRKFPKRFARQGLTTELWNLTKLCPYLWREKHGFPLSGQAVSFASVAGNTPNIKHPNDIRLHWTICWNHMKSFQLHELHIGKRNMSPQSRFLHFCFHRNSFRLSLNISPLVASIWECPYMDIVTWAKIPRPFIISWTYFRM